MGFSEWRVFNRQTKKELLRAAPKSVGVYAIRRDTSFSRIRGASDILYVGSAANQKGLHGRIGQYLSPGPTQWTNKRILALVAETTNYRISWLVTETIAKAKALEQELLELYLQEHGELPPQNLRR
jgi:excinuclease UvrABC nuclease subunit